MRPISILGLRIKTQESFLFLVMKESVVTINNMKKQTVVPIIFSLLKIKEMKIINKETMANIVVYGNHFIWKNGFSLYWERSFN